MYRVILKERAAKNLNKLDDRYKNKIIKALTYLKSEPFLGKPLQGELKGLYSLKVWPYRIIYKIYQNELIIFVISVSHRQGAYKH